MDERPEHDEGPYRRPEPNPYAWPVGFAVVLAVIAAAYYWWFVRAPEAPPAPVATAPAPKPAPRAAVEPAIRYPLAPPEAEAAKSRPTLELSDSMMREALAGLIGEHAFADRVFPSGLIRRIVATIDNLPRPRAPRRTFVLVPVPGAFGTQGSGEAFAIGAANFARYARYVRAAQALDARALVGLYVRTYPLFQRAYEELGFPGRHFNDRLVEAIDDLLDAPEVAPPVKLLQPRVLYEFADADLETRSAGQKILIRMGGDNAARVKAKLREIRRELLAAAAKR